MENAGFSIFIFLLLFRVFLFCDVFARNLKFRVCRSRGVPGEHRNRTKTLEGSAETPLRLAGARAARRERKNGRERARARFRASRATPGEPGDVQNTTFCYFFVPPLGGPKHGL